MSSNNNGNIVFFHKIIEKTNNTLAQYTTNFDPTENHSSNSAKALTLRVKENMKQLENFLKSDGEILRNHQMKAIVGGGSTNSDSSHATMEKNCSDTSVNTTRDIGDDVCKSETCVMHC